MYKLARPLFLHCISPLHAGTGNDVGYIDQPIQREKHTGFPKVESSSLKGALKEYFEENDNKIQDFNGKEITINERKNINLSFGPESGDSHAGALGFSDSRLLLFPVKSLKGIFAWVTCPRVLEKFKSELESCGFDTSNVLVSNLKKTLETVPTDSTFSQKGLINIDRGTESKVILEEYSFSLKQSDVTDEFAQKLNAILNIDNLEKRLVVLTDEEFADLVRLHTELITRIRIGENGTAASNALFNEEYLPAESVLYSLVLASSIFQPDGKKEIFTPNEKQDYELLMDYFKNGLNNATFQLGGNATLGKGLIKSTTTLL
jgi:CRISPR-associated protein Cmr4